MRLPEEPDRPSQINILPMIDVIFVILIYFIVSSLFLTRSEGLPVNLPSAATTQLQNNDQIVVSLDEKGKLAVDKKPTELKNLQKTVKDLIASKKTSLVVINADKAIEHGQVVDVMDELRQLPEAKLAIAATKE